MLYKWENLDAVELYIRVKEKDYKGEYNGNVISSETQKITGSELIKVLEPYIKSNYYNFIQTYNLSKFVSKNELKEANSFKNDVQKKESLTSFISEAISILYFDGIKPSFTFQYFDSLYTLVSNKMQFDTRLNPIYQFAKIVVPALNRFIEDHAMENYRKKHKHMLLFSLLRSFSLIPDRRGLELDGDEDVKEDFIKQLIRK